MGAEETHLLLNQVKYYLRDVKASRYEAFGKTDFEIATLGFCRDWLNDKPEFIFQTSGSTGAPKTIQLKASQMRNSALLTIKTLRLRENDTALVCLNTSLIAGAMMLARALTGNLNMVITEPASNPLLNLDASLKINFTALVPLQLQAILDHPESRLLLSQIDKVIVGGAPIPTKVVTQLQAFSNSIYQTFGMTETVSHIALKKLSGTDQSDYYTVLEGVEIDVDERGCLMVKTSITQNQWLYTNDIVKIIDRQKFLWIGRYDNVINSGGYKFHLEELENKAQRLFDHHHSDRRFFIAGLKDETLGEKITLVIEGGKDAAFLQEIKADFNNFFDKYESPKEVIFINTFSESRSGKILRKETLLRLKNH